MYDTGLADRLRTWLAPAGFQVVEVDGWQDRGRTYADFAPEGSVDHHTAGPLEGDAPSLGICINGRSDLPGPLCQVFGSRSLVAYVIAAGVANHAGGGSWDGLKGNQKVHGLELENCGDDREPLTERQADFAARIHCAFLTAPGSSSDAARTCQHFEWTPTKIDFHDWPGNDLRRRVATLLAAGPLAGLKPPAPPATPGRLVRAEWFYRAAPGGGAADGSFLYGNPGDIPVFGDWDGDGLATPGVVRDGRFLLRNSLSAGAADVAFGYGNPDDRVVVGDWDGDGRDGVGVVRGNVFYLRNHLSDGPAEEVFAYGNPGDQVAVGRWPGATRDSVAVVRSGVWYLRDPAKGTAATVFGYGDVGDLPLAGDWNGDGTDTPAVVRAAHWYLRDSVSGGKADREFAYGNPTDIPFAGRLAKGAAGDGIVVVR